MFVPSYVYNYCSCNADTIISTAIINAFTLLIMRFSFTFNIGTCIPQARFCDGQIDCTDGSDEIDSVPENATYENGQQIVVCDNRHNLMKTRCLLPSKFVFLN